MESQTYFDSNHKFAYRCPICGTKLPQQTGTFTCRKCGQQCDNEFCPSSVLTGEYVDKSSDMPTGIQCKYITYKTDGAHHDMLSVEKAADIPYPWGGYVDIPLSEKPNIINTYDIVDDNIFVDWSTLPVVVSVNGELDAQNQYNKQVVDEFCAKEQPRMIIRRK